MRPWPVLSALTGAYAVIGHGRNLVLWLRRAVRNTSELSQPRVFLPGLVIGTIGWLAAPLLLTLVLAQMGAHLPFLHATAIYAAGALAGGATMLPGGGGGTEAVLLGLLRASEVPIDAAVAAVIVTRLTFLWAPGGTRDHCPADCHEGRLPVTHASDRQRRRAACGGVTGPFWLRMGHVLRAKAGIRGAVPPLDRASHPGGLARGDLPRCRLRHGAQLVLADDLWGGWRPCHRCR